MEHTAKKPNGALFAVCIALIAVTLGVIIYAATCYIDVFTLVFLCVSGCISLFILYYLLYGYKKPHGNLLRFIMLAFALSMIFDDTLFSVFTAYVPVRTVTVMLIAYMAGRLNKFEKNRILMPVILVLTVVTAIIITKEFPSDETVVNLAVFACPVQWCIVCAAYIARYKQHKEAGLADGPAE